MNVRLGLLLPAEAGHVQLSPLPGHLGGPVADQKDAWSRFLGRVLGIAACHRMPLGILFVPSFCKLLLDVPPAFDDVRYVLAARYNSLQQLRGPGPRSLSRGDVDEALQ